MDEWIKYVEGDGAICTRGTSLRRRKGDSKDGRVEAV